MVRAYDTETTGLETFKGDSPFALIHCEEDEATARYIDLKHDASLQAIDDLQDPDTVSVWHNAIFDILMLDSMGIEVAGEIHDTMLMAHVNDPDDPKKLKDLGQKYFGREPLHEVEVKAYLRRNKLKSYADVPRAIMEPYALEDTIITMKLFNMFKSKGILENPTYKMEIELLKVLVDMQKLGALIDIPYCKEMAVACEARINAIDAVIWENWGDININSNAQIAELLFVIEGLACDFYTDKGNPQLDDYSLRQYHHPIVPLILERRELAKLQATYFQALVDMVDSHNVIHCSFYQTGAKTGRFSCHSPNLQNIPRLGTFSVRKAFICRPGYTNYYYDYNQIELRIMAHYAQDKKMLQIYKEQGDIHSETCQGIFKQITKEYRSIAKQINFGIIYGMGPKKLLETLAKEYPQGGYTYEKCMQFINRYHATYPSVKRFMSKVQNTVVRRPVHDIFGRQYKLDVNFSYRAVNHIIQGTAAGVLKNAMIKVHAYLKDKKSKLLLTIHDELVIQIHDEERDIVDGIKALMEDLTTFRVPILVNVSLTKTNWEDKEDLTLLDSAASNG